jgi:hypothetical protein
MKVNANQNPATPVQEAGVKDGTSNTLQVGEKAKPEKPFMKDSFEMARDPKTVNIPRGETNTPNVQNEIDIESKKLEVKGEKVVNDLNVKYTLFLPE